MKLARDGSIDEALRSIAGVLEAVTLRDEQSAKTYAFVVVDEDALHPAEAEAATDQEAQGEKIWSFVWDKAYGKKALDNADDFDTWVSAYDHRPIPRNEMVEWRDNTVDRIKRLKPRSVFEIGCGTGLMLWPLHAGVKSYVGIDPSAHAVEKLTAALNAQGIENTTVAKGTAAHLERYLLGRFDTVVINSVIQYFPGPHYLKSVISRVLSGGCDTLFIGDIKSLRHRAVFQASVALHQATGSEPASACLKQKDVVQANELSVSEDFLESLAGDAYVVELQLKKESYFNEMSRYRYDAIFRRATKAMPLKPDLSATFTSMAELAQLMVDHPSSIIEILNIPNSRLVADVWAFDHAAEFAGTVKELLQIADTKKSGAVDPGDLYRLGDEYSLTTRVVFSRENLSSTHALFAPRSDDVRRWVPDKGMAHPFFTNDPMQTSSTRNLAAYLKDQILRLHPQAAVDHVFLIHQLPRRGGSVDIDPLSNLIPD